MLEDYVEERLKSLGTAIKLARKEKGLRQSDLAAFAEIDRSHLQKIEGGSNTSMSTLFRICFVLEITEDELFFFANNAHSKVFIRNANKILTKGEALTSDEVTAYANKIKSLRAESTKKENISTKCLLGGDKRGIIKVKIYKTA